LGALLGSSVGSALIWRAATLALAGGALLLAWRRPPLRRVALLGVAAATLGTVVVHAGAGHADAGSWPSALTVSAQVAHIAAASVWLGGLAALVLGFRGAGGAARGEAVRRFAPIALAAVAVLFATGVLRAVDELVSWDDLLSTGYGRAVLAKLVLLALIAAIAARNRPRRRPLGAGELEGMRRRSRFELGLGILAVGLAALLGTLAPPSSTQRAPLGLEAGGHDFGTTVRAELTTASNEPGPNRFQLRVAGYDSGAPVAADSVSLRFTPLDDPSVLPSSLTLQKGSDGSWVGSGANVLFDGRWAIGALIERGGDAVEVPLQLDFPVPEQFVSVLDIPGSSRPPQYTLQTEDGFIRLTPSPDRAGRNRFYLRTFSAFENSVAGDQIVVTAASAAGPTRQLPVQRLGPARFVAVAPLAAGPVEVGVFARTQYGSRLRGVFKLEIPN
jgi:putative copper export protein